MNALHPILVLAGLATSLFGANPSNRIVGTWHGIALQTRTFISNGHKDSDSEVESMALTFGADHSFAAANAITGMLRGEWKQSGGSYSADCLRDLQRWGTSMFGNVTAQQAKFNHLKIKKGDHSGDCRLEFVVRIGASKTTVKVKADFQS